MRRLVLVILVGCSSASSKPVTPRPDDPPDAAVAAAPRLPFAVGAELLDVVDLVPAIPNASAPTSVVATGSPATLWVAMQATDGDAVLYQVSDPAGTPQVATRVIGSGYPSASSLVVVDGEPVCAFSGGPITVVRYTRDGQVARLAELPVAHEMSGDASLAVVGDRLLAAWDGNNEPMEYAWIDADGAVDGPHTLPSSAMFPIATAAFGGAVFWVDAEAGLQMLRVDDSGAAPRDVTDDARGSASAAGTADRGWIVNANQGASWMAPSTIELIAVAQDHATGARLGQTSSLAESGLVATEQGLLAVWLGADGEVVLAVATRDGALVGDPLVVSAAGEHARKPSVAWLDGQAYVVWNQVGTRVLRLARLTVR